MPRLYREMPLTSIWEGSGNVMALDVLRALGREPAALGAYLDELDAAAGADARLDAFCARAARPSSPIREAIEAARAADRRAHGARAAGRAARAPRAAGGRRRVLRLAPGRRRRPAVRHAAGGPSTCGDRRAPHARRRLSSARRAAPVAPRARAARPQRPRSAPRRGRVRDAAGAAIEVEDREAVGQLASVARRSDAPQRDRALLAADVHRRADVVVGSRRAAGGRRESRDRCCGSDAGRCRRPGSAAPRRARGRRTRPGPRSSSWRGPSA